jgi:hypothetical protein
MPIPIKGDRSAFDDIDYPEKHSADLEAGTPIHHLPINASEGDTIVWRTDHWELEAAGGSGSVELMEGAVGYGDSDDILTGDIDLLNFSATGPILQLGASAVLDTLVPSIYSVGDAKSARVASVSFGDTPIISGWKTNGTKAAPTGIVENDELINISVVGYAVGSWRAARNFIKAIATETWSATARGAKWLLQTTLNGTDTAIDALELTGTEAIFGVPIVPISMADDDAPINGLYFSTDLGRLVYKHEGAVHELYSDVLESISPSPSFSPSLSASRSDSPSYSPSPSMSKSASASISPSLSQSKSDSPSYSPSPSVSKSASASYSPSSSASKSSSSSLSPSPSLSKSASVSVSRSPSQSPSSSASPSLSASTSIPQLIDSYSESNCDSGISLGFNTIVGLGQSFVGDGLGTLHSCKFWMKKSSTPIGNMVARVYETTDYVINKIPTGSPIATSVAIDVSTLTTSYQLITFTFTGGNKASLEDGVIYAITCQYSGDMNISHLIVLGIDLSSPTHAGNICSFDGATWMPGDALNEVFTDLCFYIYED